MPLHPVRGDIWLTELDPVRGREQSGRRPALVVSVDAFNQGGSTLAIILPTTTTERRLRSHVRIVPPEGGIRRVSYIKCEDIRSISTERLVERWGAVSGATLDAVADRLRMLLGL